jgi:hypothetical protein
MNEPTENELELWLESEEGQQIQRALVDEIGELPGENTIADKVTAEVFLPTTNRIAQLESGLRRWRIAAVFAVAACVAFALLVLSNPRSLKREATEIAAAPSSTPRVRSVAAKLSETREKLARITPSSDFASTRKFKR